MKTEFDYSMAEQMIVSAAREIRDGDLIYTGVGLPQVAVLLAQISHAPHLTVFLETGIVRTQPCTIGRGVDTPDAQHMADMLTDVCYVNCVAQRGLYSLGFLGAGQIDRYGNINGTCIGDYRNPTMRFPGPGGSTEVASFCHRIIVILIQKKQRFPERVDFISAPGYLDGKPGSREREGLLRGTGPTKVITNLGIYSFVEREMVLDSVHRDITMEDIRANLSWDIKVAEDLKETLPPTDEEMSLLYRIDPKREYITGGTVL